MNATLTEHTGTSSRPLTDDPSVEAQTLRGIWFGLLMAAPVWLLIAALIISVL